MTIDLKPSQEQLVQEARRSGRYRTIDEFLSEALSAWKKGEAQGFDLQKAQAAAASIRQLRQGVTLGGLKLKIWLPKDVREQEVTNVTTLATRKGRITISAIRQSRLVNTSPLERSRWGGGRCACR